MDFRESIEGLVSLGELDIKVAVFEPALFVFLNRARNRVKILYWERNGFCQVLFGLPKKGLERHQVKMRESYLACAGYTLATAFLKASVGVSGSYQLGRRPDKSATIAAFAKLAVTV